MSKTQKQPDGAERLHIVIARRKLKQSTIAEVLGCAPSRVSQILSCVRTPTLHEAVILSDVYRVPVRSWVA